MNNTFVIVDPQNDFIEGIFGSEYAKKVADAIAEFITTIPSNGHIIITKDIHLEDDPEFNLFTKHCIKDTKGSSIYSPIKKALNNFKGKKTIIEKSTFGTHIPIEDDNIFIRICGFCTDICVLCNSIYLKNDYPKNKVILIKGLCAGTTKEAHDKSLDLLKGIGIEVIA